MYRNKQYRAVQYTGANATEVMALADEVSDLFSADIGFSVTGHSESGGQLHITYSSSGVAHLSVDDWLVFDPPGLQVRTEAEYNYLYPQQDVPVVTTIIGVEPVTALTPIVNPDDDFVVDLPQEMADADYELDVFLVGAAGSLSYSNVGKTPNTVTLNVATNLAYVAGAQIVVVARGVLA